MPTSIMLTQDKVGNSFKTLNLRLEKCLLQKYLKPQKARARYPSAKEQLLRFCRITLAMELSAMMEMSYICVVQRNTPTET